MYKFKIPDDPRFDMLIDIQLKKKTWLEISRKEINDLSGILANLNPKTVVDWGCGIGRSAVNFFHSFNWDDATFKMCDKTGLDRFINGREWINKDGKQLSAMGSFNHHKVIAYNDLDFTKKFCNFNDLRNLELVDVETVDDLGSPDLFYSLHCVGYHFSIKKFLEDVKVDAQTIIFGIRKSHHKTGSFDVDHLDGYSTKIVKGTQLQNYLVFKKDNS